MSIWHGQTWRLVLNEIVSQMSTRFVSGNSRTLNPRPQPQPQNEQKQKIFKNRFRKHRVLGMSIWHGQTWRLVLNEIVSQMSPKWLPKRSLFIPPIDGPSFRRSSNQNCCRVASFYKPDFMLEFGTKSIMKCRPEWYHECLQNVFPGTTLRSPKPHNPKSQTCATNPKSTNPNTEASNPKPQTLNLKAKLQTANLKP